ncbi:protection of telomeres protein 1 isoform X2 [Ascaphus truei]|uniref:protection of telomeres protein 1 isoform X2 n=1 Tax=Ascaphus truei TaxID=8439 RepID=UPI003F594BAC
MPVLVLKEEDGPLEAQLPSHLRKAELQDLQLGVTHRDRYFLGRVLFTYPSTKLGNGLELFKTVLEDPSETSSSKIKTINTFFFGKLAEDCGKVIRQGDTLVVSGVHLTNSPSGSRDGRHSGQLEVKEENGATVYVLIKSGILSAARAGSSAPLQKYIYTPLEHLKEGVVSNLFGIVKFFKPPYRSKGTDFCSVVTVVDQSDAKLKCMLFSGNSDTLPKIYKVGDIVRFHRIKIQKFNDEIQGINSSGFSALVFDGTVGAPIVPRTSSKCFSFNTEDQKTIEVLRDWAASHNFSGSRVKLSDIQPVKFFDLTCQLVGKAEVDKSSYLLKVWDGTKCVSPTWKVCVEDDALEGDRTLMHQLLNLTVDILVYDNHVEVAKYLKVGSYVVIHSIHAKLHTASNENQANASHLEFHLHGGTCYGRGITVLPENNYDVKELQRSLDSVDLKEYQCVDDISSLELTNSLQTTLSLELPSSGILERCQQLSVTVLAAHQQWETIPLTTIIRSKAPQKYRIRARLKSFEPRNLYESVKLHCTKCKSLQNVPDEDDLNIILNESSRHCPNPNLQNTSWYQSAVWKTSNQRNRLIAIHFVKKDDMQQNPENTLIMIEGGTLQEVCKLSRQFDSIIPVKSNHERLAIDLSAPFLIQGNRWHYGCRSCSNLKNVDALHSLSQEDSWNATEIAKVLGIEPLRHVFLMQFTFDDETELLNAFLWNYSEQFFQIPASEICFNNKLQEKLHGIMDILCPPRKKLNEYPWLECCIKSYNSTDGREKQICYELFDTVVAEECLK